MLLYILISPVLIRKNVCFQTMVEQLKIIIPLASVEIMRPNKLK